VIDEPCDFGLLTFWVLRVDGHELACEIEWLDGHFSKTAIASISTFKSPGRPT
jgi:hypothetical protein